MLDRHPTWSEELADERREGFVAYLRSQLAETQARRAVPQTRDDHEVLARREAHYDRLLRAMR